MVRRNISAAPWGVKQGSERAARLAAGFAAGRGEGAADLALDHVGDRARLLRRYASLLFFPSRRLAPVAVDLAEQAEAEPDGADDGDKDQQLAEAGYAEHRAI